MAKTSRDAWRHYHALMDLFGDLDVVGNEILENFILGYKKRREIRQSFRRLTERGFIKESTRGWKLTAEGLCAFQRNKLAQVRAGHKTWDKKWRLISFDVPMEHNAKRKFLRSLLTEFNFFSLQKSVWVSPYAVEGKLVKLLEDLELWEYCKLMVVDILEGDEDLRRHFNLPPRQSS